LKGKKKHQLAPVVGRQKKHTNKAVTQETEKNLGKEVVVPFATGVLDIK